MRRNVNNEACPICGNIPYDSERRVLVLGRLRRSYCSQACLRVGVRQTQAARRKALWRGAAIVVSLMLVVAGGVWVRHLLRARRPPQVAASAPPPPAPDEPMEPTPFGPHWPPTDEEWQEQFAQATWAYPLPGPARRWPKSTRELVIPEAGDKRARCRTADRCGVNLGGELWGEHVYAAHDGVVERVQRASDDTPGGVYVRIAHWGGAVFTQYFHLAAVPSRLNVGTRVSAGDVIGLVGNTGLADARPHLRFAISVRPSKELPEVFWDPEPLMALWPLHTPARGSVAGLAALEGAPEHLAGTPLLPPRRR